MPIEKRYHKESKGYEMEPVFIAKSPAMKELINQIDMIAKTEATVLITGESGTGKEVVSQLIHHRSKRSQGPFIALNCGAIPRDIVESELFGHEKGAFTGATTQKEGCFELADKGTLFLDEIGEMAPDIQVKLLRAVEYKAFRRVGGKKEIETDVRIIAATNRDMSEALSEGEFRKDLFYRLSVIELHIPPLRERSEDIPDLVNHFLNIFASKYNSKKKKIHKECMKLLKSYRWPGNVRELRNTIERCVIMCPNRTISPAYLTNDISGLNSHEDLEPEIPDPEDAGEAVVNGVEHNNTNGNGVPSNNDEINIPAGTSMKEAEKILIDKTLSLVNNNKSEAARILGFSRTTLHNKLDKYSE